MDIKFETTIAKGTNDTINDAVVKKKSMTILNKALTASISFTR